MAQILKPIPKSSLESKPVQQVHGEPSKKVLTEILKPIPKPSTNADKLPRNGLSKPRLKRTVKYDENGVDEDSDCDSDDDAD